MTKLMKRKPKDYGRITTVRLPEEVRQKLETIASIQNTSISQVLINTIDMAYEKEDNEIDSYTLGIPYFPKKGDPGIGPKDLAENHKIYFYAGLLEQHHYQSRRFDEHIKDLQKKKAAEKNMEKKYE